MGPEIAEHLSIPHIAYVSEIREVSNDRILVVSDLGDGYYLVEMKLPGLIAVTKDINVPRLPTLRDKLRARKAIIEVWSADELVDVADVSRFGYVGSPTIVHRVFFPSERGRKAIIFRGVDAVDKLVEVLIEEGLLG